MKDSGKELINPDVDVEYKINLQVAVVMAGAMHIIACLGTRKALQAVDVLMRLESEFEKIIYKEEKHA